MQNKTFRLFVSSTFSDFNEERKLLQTIVFPEIKKYCRDNGLNFQPIDLRWGVTEEASNDQKTLSLCLEEVQSSKYHPYPNFIIMAGDRYGWVPLPYAIEQNEYETILQIIDDLSSKELLNTWYVLDVNQIPASYILNERKKSDSSHDGVDYTNRDNWRKIENQLKTILQISVEKSNLNEKEKRKYFTSATEAEVIEGIYKYLYKTKFQNKLLQKNEKLENIDYEHVYAYIRNIKSLDNESFRDKFLDKNPSKVTDFKNEIKKSIDQSNILDVDVNLKDIFQDSKNGSLNYKYETISNSEKSIFVKKMIGYLKSSIDKYIEISKDISIEELEKYEQQRFKKFKLKDFLKGSRQDALNIIDDYINNDNNQALVIYGKSGLGKSSLMAKAIDDSLSKYPNKKIIYRFVGSTVTLNLSVEILISILKEFGINEKIRKAFNTDTYQIEHERIEYFYYRVFNHLISLKVETIIFIDAVDQLINEDNFFWLPKKLPSNLKIIISALNDKNYEEDSKYFEKLKDKSNNLYKLNSFDSSEELISFLLASHNRIISKNQFEYLENIYKDINTPLYLSVASQEIRHWKSHDESQILASTQNGIIEEYILNLSELYHHEKEFVKRVFSYIYLTDGVSEAELLEIFSVNEDFIEYIAPDTYHKKESKELPVVIWARLYSQIKEFIKYESVNNQEIMSFFHREFLEAISQIEDIKNLHEELVILLQKLIVKYQYEPIESNRWSNLYIELIKKFHLKYEFDYLPDNNSKLKSFVEFFYGLENWQYINEIIKILNFLGNEFYKINNIVVSNFCYKSVYYILNIFYIDNPSKWVENYILSLNNLAISLNSIRKVNEAIEFLREFLELSKKLYKENPLKWVIDYTLGLNNLALYVESVGKIDEAIELGREALEIRKKLYKDNPSKWAEDYAKSLNNLGISLNLMGNIDEAIKLSEEALKIRKKLYEDNPLKYVESYITSLNNTAILSKSIKKINEVTKLREGALEISKKLYKDNSSRWAKVYSNSLNYSAMFFKSINKIDEAIKLGREALEIRKKFYEENPLISVEDYITSLNNLIYYLNLSGQIDEAIKLGREALEIIKNLYEDDSKIWADHYTNSLNNLAFSLKDIGKIDEAIELQREALEIIKNLYKDNPEIRVEDYTESLCNLADSLNKIEKIDEAIDFQKESLEITKNLYKDNPSRWVEDYTNSLSNLAISLKGIVKLDEAIEFEKEALEIRKNLYKDSPSRWAKDYTNNLNNLASLYLFNKQFNMSSIFFDEYFKVMNFNQEEDIRNFMFSWIKWYQCENYLNNIEKIKDLEKLVFELKCSYKNKLKENYFAEIKREYEIWGNFINSSNDELIKERFEIFKRFFYYDKYNGEI